MFTSLQESYVLFALIALLPGAVSWWSGRQLARLADDPALPELLASHQRRNGVMLVIAMIVFAVVAPWTFVPLAFPLIFAGLVAAAYPMRRVLFHETWSFWSYFCFYPRVFAGVVGFWIVLGAMPSLAALAGEGDWLAGAALAGVLVVWNVYHADAVRFCLRTRPIAEGELLSRCRALADKCGVAQPRFECIDLGGGVIANALALPSLRTSSVVFTDTLLERFDQQEILGICAHELAHFEHFNAGYLRRLNFVNLSLIALGVAYAPVVRIAGLDSGPLPVLVWLGALVVPMAMRGRGNQRRETICDLRALELTGDEDALVRGLTKLCTIARVPRRMGQQTERAATHPSLARRIRDIRRAAGAAPAVLSGAESFTSADGRTEVVFDDAGLQWVERDAVTHSFSYTNLTELRVDSRPGRGSRLVALGSEARLWKMTLADSDVARLQTVLDVVDGRLGDPPRPRTIPFGMQRVAILMAAMIVLMLSHFVVAFVALLAWLKPSLPLLAGAGLAALTAAALVLRDYPGATYAIVIALPLAGIGLALLGFAWGHRHDDRANLWPFISPLALAAALAVTALTINGVDVIRLHQSARTMPFATVLLVALAGALACSQVRRERLAAAAVGLGALAVTLAASTAFLDRFATDPFLVDAPAFEWVALGSAAIGEFDVPSGTSRIDLSPNGQYVAAYQNADSDEDHSSTFQVGRAGEALASITADDLAFVSDDLLLIVQSDPHGTTLKTVRVGRPQDVVRQQFMEDLSAPSLSFERATGRWRVMGRGGDESIVRVEGVVGSSEVQKKRWPPAYTRGSYIDALTTAGPEVLFAEKRYDRGPLARVIPWQWTWAHLLMPYNQVSRYATVSDGGRRTFGESRLDAECMADVLLDESLTCIVYDGTRTRILTIDGRTGNVEGIGLLDGRFASDQNVVRGWLTGWAGSRPVAIRLSTGEVLYMPERAGPATLLSVAGGRLSAVVWGDDHFTVRVYPVPPDTPTAGRACGQEMRSVGC
jgi:Zn-dependent protease with chaperone function